MHFDFRKPELENERTKRFIFFAKANHGLVSNNHWTYKWQI